MIRWGCFLLLLAVGCSEKSPKSVSETHPLDTWSDEIMYFVMTDRFADGDSSNNHLGFGEFDPQKTHTYHGGDLAGLQQNISYLQNLGVTSIWITPPVRNAVWSRDSSVTGYHGYWANHFAQVDPHLGSLNDYQKLALALHANQMRLVQDVVTNHVADYFSYEGDYDAQQPWQNFKRYGRPMQPPFHLNDARNAKHRSAAIYNFTPAISNYQDSVQKLTWQMSDLDDLNTRNPKVIEALKKSFRYWIDSVGIDGIRFDTPLYVDHPFWHRFLHDSTSKIQGLKPHARLHGKPWFYTFGETWVHSGVNDEQGELLAQKYLGSAEKPEMDGILHFPMQQSIQRVFGGGAPTQELQYRLLKEQSYFPQPRQRLHFIDNHDMPRFRAGNSESATRQALAFTLTIPGIPVIYYGTEQGLTETRGNLFGKLDSSSADFKFLQALIRLRKSSHCFSRGKLEVIASDAAAAGIFCYRLTYGKDEKWVLFNTADYPLLSGKLTLGGKASGEIKVLLQEGSVKASAIHEGEVNLVELGPKAFVIFEIQKGTGKSAQADIRWTLPSLPDTLLQSNLKLAGKISRTDSLKVFLNGNVGLASTASLANGNFEVDVSFLNAPAQKVDLLWVAYKNGRAHCLTSQKLLAALPDKQLKAKSDPALDDKGPKGAYSYPTAFGNLRSMDFRKASLSVQGNRIRLLVTFEQAFSQSWNPPLGFDHLQLNVLLHWNEEAGGTQYRLANYATSQGKKISRILQINGWQVQAFRVDSTNQMLAISSSAEVRIVNQKTMEIWINPELLGFPQALKKLDVTLLSWDSAGEGGFRTLEKRASAYTFGGGSAQAPLWMDELKLSWQSP